MVLRPCMDPGRSARGDIALNDMHRHAGPDPFGNMIGEGGEFLRAVPRLGPAGGGVAPAVMRSGRGMSGRHRQRLPRPPRRLDPRPFIHRQHHRMVGRAGMKSGHIPDLRPGSRETLKVFTRCGSRQWRRRMSRTVETTMSPMAPARAFGVQCPACGDDIAG